MKPKLTFLSGVLFVSLVNAQTYKYHDVYQNGTKDPQSLACSVEEEKSECITDEQRLIISKEIEKNKTSFYQKGILKQNPVAMTAPVFIWPLQWAPGVNDYNYYYFSQYVNHDTINSNTPLDYNCGNRSYYNTASAQYHKGTDIGLWPFKWIKMDSSFVQIVAAAPGIIAYKSDGNFDRSCGFNNNPWNAVYILHPDGSETWYGHMKSGSVTSKNVGDSVSVGEYLGTVGSSGNSTGVHLHFEVHDPTGKIIDPFSGTCNNFNSTSWWAVQKPYDDSGVNHVHTGHTYPVFPACSAEEIRNESDYFMPGDTIHFLTYFRDLDSLDQMILNIYTPSGSIWSTYAFTSGWAFSKIAWYGRWYVLGTGVPTGTWHFDAIYKGQTYTHVFYVGNVAGINNNSVANSVGVYPNPANDVINIRVKNNLIGSNYFLFDVAGRKILSGKLSNETTVVAIDVLSPGIYFLKFGEQNMQSVKIIKR